ncbi:MAG: branched-chain-amino-acid transaminase [Acidimicrobiales bacterium]|nr:branched-chain-amino-acid transaminase [Acidimicrobiales bacterium]MCB9394221.1 branched-chain-amino-acid transaminase [Acidimicrobiaceae bacterium]
MTSEATTTDPSALIEAAASAPFGTVFGEVMSVAEASDAGWTQPSVVPLTSFTMHPGMHALHYGSSCFEGLKAHRTVDGAITPFRADKHAARLQQSAARLMLPIPPLDLVTQLIDLAIEANGAVTPPAPGSLYLRPTLLGTDVTIGAAAYPSHSAVLYVLACPVGDYLPPRPLTIVVETEVPRTTPQFGVVKTGANYAMALGRIDLARREHHADQVLFAPGGVVQETGAANVVLVDGDHLVTPELTDAFLHGVTRDSLLQVARSLGWTVEERTVTVDEVAAWAARPGAEIGLMGTAAVIAQVGTLVVGDRRIELAAQEPSKLVELRRTLGEIQTGARPFTFA